MSIGEGQKTVLSNQLLKVRSIMLHTRVYFGHRLYCGISLPSLFGVLAALTYWPPPIGAAPPSVAEICRAIGEQRELLGSADMEVVRTYAGGADWSAQQRWLNKIPFDKITERYVFKGEKKRYVLITRTGREIPPEDLPAPVVHTDAPASVQQEQRLHLEQYNRDRKALLEQRQRNSAVPETELSHMAYPELRIYNGETLWTQEAKDTGMMHSTRSMPPYQFPLYYLLLVGIYIEDPSATTEVREGTRLACLPAVLTRSDVSVVEDKIETTPCLRVETTVPAWTGKQLFRHVFWLDPSKGFIALRHEIYDKDSGRIISRILSSDAQNFSGVWLPRRLITEEFAPTYAPADLAGKPLSVSQYQVTKFEVNAVTDEVFEYGFKPGTKLMDFRRSSEWGSKSYMPAMYTQGLDNGLEDNISYARRMLGTGRPRFLTVAISSLFAMASFVIVIWYRHFKKKAQSA